jgi:tetratricopeptide (TPR) repeat protein
VRAFLQKGDALREAGRQEEAIACYDRAIAIDARYSDGIAWGLKGLALSDLDREDEAVACYEEKLKIDPADAIACLNIGVVRHNQGRVEESIRWYRAALERDPKNRRAKIYLDDALKQRS